MSLSIGKLRLGRKPKPPRDPEGRMTLFEHLAELRARLFKACLGIAGGMTLAWILYGYIYPLLARPVEAVEAEFPDLTISINFANVAGAFMLQLQVSLMAGLVISSPIWLYQVWAFINPGLHANERKWTMVFVGTAAPLFAAGVVVGYITLPKGLSFLIGGFTPDGASNIMSADEYYSIVLRILLIFGIAFLIPIFVVLLNVVGVLSARRLAKWRAGIVFGIFVFAAVATPTGDPITMLLLAGPMSLLFFSSEIIARMIERARRKQMLEEDPDLVVFGDDD